MYIQCGYSVYCTLLTAQSDQGHLPTCVGGGGGGGGLERKVRRKIVCKMKKEMLSHN